MAKFKITYDTPFSFKEEVIEADSIEEAKQNADLKSVYSNVTVEEMNENKTARLSGNLTSRLKIHSRKEVKIIHGKK
jgi:hypothetical protein